MRLHRLARRSAALLLLAAACADKPPTAPKTREYVFRAISGISMGAIGAGAIGPRHPHRFDLIAALGGPFDAAFMLGGIERSQIGGFCPYARLAQAAADGLDLNDPALFDDCMPLVGAGDNDGYEHAQNFNHFRFTKDGGTFDRSAYLDLFEDLALAFGNPMYWNPDHALFPHPSITRARLAAVCSGTPLRIPGLLNKEFNPEGRFDAIAFCDGEEPVFVCSTSKRWVNFCRAPAGASTYDRAQADCASEGGAYEPDDDAKDPSGRDIYWREHGRYDPCLPHHEPVTWAVAIDFNGNGQRDYAEPIVVNGHERWSDVGADGCPDALEDGLGGCSAMGRSGDSNHDNFHFRDNPAGTEHDRRWNPGEPWEDYGLDGVRFTDAPGAQPDFGEGNGRYDDGPRRQNFFAHDPASNFAKWTEEERARVDIYVEGGIRDVFNFGVSASWVLGGMRRWLPGETAVFDDWTSLPSLTGGWPSGFNWEDVDWPKVPRSFVVRYGKQNPTKNEIYAGDGDHVGGASGVVNRLVTFYSLLSEKWSFLGKAPIEAGSPTFEATSFPSQALGAERDYVIFLPSGYAEDPTHRYPVVYVGHGYGMDPAGMSGASIIADGLMRVGKMVPMIFVFPNGRCCFRKGTVRKCTELENVSTGAEWGDLGYDRECLKGSFYVDGQGNGGAYGQAYIELMDWVDAHYRTLGPQVLDVVAKE